MRKLLSTIALLGVVAVANAQYTNTTIKLGQKAPDLAANTPEGKQLRLSEVNKGNYVLVDFWASWCGPCRHANPGLVRMYQEYSKKKFKGAKNGFTVFSVSLDKTKEAWMQAIQADNLSWPNQICDFGYWNSAAAAAYGIQFIPQAFLLDPNGKVLGKYQAAEEAEIDLKKYVN